MSHWTFGAAEVGREATFFRGCVAIPFFKSSGMMSVALERLIVFRQTGHCDRFGSPGPVRFSPAMRASIRQVWQKRCPHEVAVRSVGLSMQMTHVKVLNVVGASSGFVCDLTASSRCFCSTSCTGSLSSVRSTSSGLGGSALSGCELEASSRFCRFADGPGVVDSLFLRCGGESGVAVKST